MDCIYYNGTIVTMDGEKEQAQAVGVKDGIIVQVGSDEEVLKWKTVATEVVDLHGKLLLPGFIDSHMHLVSTALAMEQLNLNDTKSLAEMIRIGENALATRSNYDGDFWLQGRGWNQDYWVDSALPTREDLDQISKEIPICFTRVCGHMCVVNSKALEVMEISEGTEVEGGTVEVGMDGRPNGILTENALYLAYEKFPVYTLKDIKRMIETTSKLAASKGLTTVYSDDFCALSNVEYDVIIQAYLELIEEGKLGTRVVEQCLLDSKEKLQAFIDRNLSIDRDYFSLGPLKLLVDGSLGAKTAFVSDGYVGEPNNKGVCCYTQVELDDLILLAHKNHLPCAVHCIGDGAMKMTLDSIEKAQEQQPISDMRHGIVHCQITDEEILMRFKSQNIVAYIQPIFLNYDLHIVEKRVGKTLANTSYNWKTMVDLGVNIACGSDAPIEDFDVLPNIYSAVTRSDLDGNPPGGWNPEQRLSVAEAVYGFTMGSAYASYKEKELGSITVGKRADFVVLEKNIFEINPYSIKDVNVEMTILGGKVMFQNQIINKV